MVFVVFPLPSSSSDLKVPVVSYKNASKDCWKNEEHNRFPTVKDSSTGTGFKERHLSFLVNPERFKNCLVNRICLNYNLAM